MSGSNANAPLYQPAGVSPGYQFATPSYQPSTLEIGTQASGWFSPDTYNIFSPAFTASASSFSGIDPSLLTAAFDTFQQAGNQAIGTVSNYGGFLFQGTQGTLQGWETDQATLATSIAATLQTVANKSAKAPSGFFSSLFG